MHSDARSGASMALGDAADGLDDGRTLAGRQIVAGHEGGVRGLRSARPVDERAAIRVLTDPEAPVVDGYFLHRHVPSAHPTVLEILATGRDDGMTATSAR